MSASDDVERDMATLRKEEKIDLAELRKCKAYAQNAVAAALPTGADNPGFTDGGEFNTIGSFKQQPAAVATPYNPDVKSHCLIPSNSFVVEDVVGLHYPVARPETGKVGSVNNASDITGIGSPNVGGGEVDTNPTHTGMPAPVVEPDGAGRGFRTETNTGSGTHFSMN